MPNSLSLQREFPEQKRNFDWSHLVHLISSQLDNTPEILTAAGVSLQALLSLAVSPSGNEESYGRNVLYKDKNFEVMLATWNEGAECAPHDHGFSKGVVWLVHGDFKETHYHLEQDLVVLGKPIFRPVGTLLSVTPGDIHSMVALVGGISLHIYTPAIQEMKVFDALNRRTLFVSDDCGAWIPTDSKHILSQEEWS